MSNVVRFRRRKRRRHARTSSREPRVASNFSVTFLFPEDEANSASAAQCGPGMPRLRQPLTVESDCPSAAATTPVPPRYSMMASELSITPHLVRAARTSQELARCETTFSSGYVAIAGMEPDSDQAVGRRIIALRNRANLQQQQLASQLNITKSTLSAYESGDRPLTMESARRLRRRFGVTVDWLMFGDMQATGTALMLSIGPEPADTPAKKVRALRK